MTRAQGRGPRTRSSGVALALGLLLACAACGGKAERAQGTGRAPAAVRALVGTVGPGFTIAIDDPHGRRVTRTPPGRYELTVHDRSAVLDFHFSGPGVNERTSVSGTGTARWTVELEPGLYRYRCDLHETLVSGVLRVT